MDLKATPALAGAELSVGDVLQVATHDAVGAIVGTAAFVILQLYPADVTGRCIEAECIGCQPASHLASLSMLFPGQGVAPRAGILHLCAGDRLACQPLAPSRTILDVDTLRRRKKELIHEAWISVPGGPEPMQAEPDGAGLKLASDGASSASGVSHGSPFHEAPGRGGSLRNEIRTLAGRQPGRLYQSSLLDLRAALGTRPGAGGDPAAQWVTYLNSIMMSKFKIDPAMYQELLTLATGLNSLGAGEVDKVGNLLVQRWKALEAKLSGQSAAVPALELVDADGLGVLGRDELRLAQRAQQGLLRLRDGRARCHLNSSPQLESPPLRGPTPPRPRLCSRSPPGQPAASSHETPVPPTVKSLSKRKAKRLAFMERMQQAREAKAKARSEASAAERAGTGLCAMARAEAAKRGQAGAKPPRRPSPPPSRRPATRPPGNQLLVAPHTSSLMLNLVPEGARYRPEDPASAVGAEARLPPSELPPAAVNDHGVLGHWSNKDRPPRDGKGRGREKGKSKGKKGKDKGKREKGGKSKGKTKDKENRDRD